LVTLTEPTELRITSQNAYDDTSCYGNNRGKIVIGAAGGTPPYQYSVNLGNPWSANPIFENLSVGSYKVFLKDDNGCMPPVEGMWLNLNQPPKVIITSLSSTDITTCFGGTNGTITTTASGGSHDLFYSIDDGATYQKNNGFFTGLNSTVVYRVKVKDTHNCFADPVTNSTGIWLNQPPQLIITSVSSQNIACFEGNNGFIEINSIGGSGQVQYSINNGANYMIMNRIEGLVAGNYIPLVKDAQNCTATWPTNITLTQPTKLVISNEIITDVNSCYGFQNGSIEIIASGGINPIEYSIDGGQSFYSFNKFNNLFSGTEYFVMVKDANSCYTTGNQHTINQPSFFYISSHSKTDIKACSGSPTGIISVTTGGGIAPYSFSVDNGVTYQSDNIFSTLTAGIYQTKAKDAHNCIADGIALEIKEPQKIKLSNVLSSNISCNGFADGNITMVVTGGQAPLRYSIDDGVSYQQGFYFSKLQRGIYTLRVKDMYNCELGPPTLPYILIDEPLQLNFSTMEYSNVKTCFGNKDAWIKLGVSGGIPPIQYSLNNGVSFSETGYFADLGAGANQIYVRDANFCFLKGPTITISQPHEISFLRNQKIDITCNGGSDGKIYLEATGGTGIINYSIDGGTNFSTQTVYTGLAKGAYLVMARDEKGCVRTGSNLSVVDPLPVQVVSSTYKNISCPNENDGTLGVVVNGGIGGYEFSLDGVLYQTSSSFSKLTNGTYIVKVRDANKCAAESAPIVISRPISTAAYEMSAVNGCSPFSVSFKKITSNPTYLWTFGDGSTSNSFSPTHIFINNDIVPKTFKITSHALSTTGCADSFSTSVTVNPQPNVNFAVFPKTQYFPNSTITIQNLCQSGYKNYNWDFGDGDSSQIENPKNHSYATCGTYLIELTAANSFNCYDTAYQTVKLEPEHPFAVFSTDYTEGCSPLSINFTNKSTKAVSYLWTFGDGAISTEKDPTYIYSEKGKYNVSLTAKGECGVETSVNKIITVLKTPIAIFSVTPDTIMLPDQFVRCFNATENGDFYQWNFGDDSTSNAFSPSHKYAKVGTYAVSLKVRSADNCKDSLVVQNAVTVLPAADLRFPTAFSPNGDGVNDIFLPVFEGIRKYELNIYNRFGYLVFSSKDINTGWDGTCGGQLCAMDTYVWKVFASNLTGTPFILSGDVTLVP